MFLDEYQSLAVRTAKPLPTLIDNLAHAGIGFVTEIGEFASEVKRIVIYQKHMSEEMRQHMLEELGDLMWYVALAINSLDLSISKAINAHQHVVVRDFDEYQASILASNPNMTLGHVVRCMARDAGSFLKIIDELAADGREPSRFDRDSLTFYALWQMQWATVATWLLGHSMGSVAGDNIAKLRKRYPEQYTNHAAEARADKGGLEHTKS